MRGLRYGRRNDFVQFARAFTSSRTDSRRPLFFPCGARPPMLIHVAPSVIPSRSLSIVYLRVGGRPAHAIRHFFSRTTSSCCADEYILFAAGVHLSARPPATTLTGFANDKRRRITTRDGRIGLRRFWVPSFRRGIVSRKPVPLQLAQSPD